jgi:hypothetical protein
MGPQSGFTRHRLIGFLAAGPLFGSGICGYCSTDPRPNLNPDLAAQVGILQFANTGLKRCLRLRRLMFSRFSVEIAHTAFDVNSASVKPFRNVP